MRCASTQVRILFCFQPYDSGYPGPNVPNSRSWLSSGLRHGYLVRELQVLLCSCMYCSPIFSILCQALLQAGQVLRGAICSCQTS